MPVPGGALRPPYGLAYVEVRDPQPTSERLTVSSVLCGSLTLTIWLVAACVGLVALSPAASLLLAAPTPATSLFLRLPSNYRGPQQPWRRRQPTLRTSRTTPYLHATPATSRAPPEGPPEDPDLIHQRPWQPPFKNAVVGGAVVGAVELAAVELAALTAGAAEVMVEATVGTVAAEAAAGMIAAEATGAAVVGTAGAVGLGNTAASLAGGYILAFGTGSLRADLLAGIVAVIVATIATHPIDTMKTRLQAGRPPVGSQGLRGLYHGLLYSLFKKCPETSIYVAIYHGLREALLRRALTDATLLSVVFVKCMVVSSLAGALAASFLKVPFEIVNRQMQVGTIAHGRDLLAKFLSEGETRVFVFVSWLAVLLRDIPKTAVQFGLVYVLEFMGSGFLAGVPIFFQRMICAAIAGALAAFLTTPLDLLSLKVMTTLERELHPPEGAYGDKPGPPILERRPILRALRTIVADLWQAGGLRGLWKGALLRTATYVPGSCIFYAVFETLVALRGH